MTMMRKYLRAETEITAGKCSVKGCEEKPTRNISRDVYERYLGAAFLEVNKTKKGDRKLHVCDEHYKSLKKVSKKDAEAERYRRGF